MYTICAMVHESAIPSVYILMANRQGRTYIRALQVIKEKLNTNYPVSIITDFEEGILLKNWYFDFSLINLAALNAINYVFPGTTTRLCLFHLAQSVMRRVKKEKLSTAYKASEDLRKKIRSLSSLAFLPENLVLIGFNALLQRTTQVAAPIFTYFKRSHLFKFKS